MTLGSVCLGDSCGRISVCHVLRKLKNCKEATSSSIYLSHCLNMVAQPPFMYNSYSLLAITKKITYVIEKSYHSFPLLSQHDLKHKISREILCHPLTFSCALFQTLKFKKRRVYECVLHFGMYNLKFVTHEKPER